MILIINKKDVTNGKYNAVAGIEGTTATARYANFIGEIDGDKIKVLKDRYGHSVGQTFPAAEIMAKWLKYYDEDEK
jgi:hypothetical protein